MARSKVHKQIIVVEKRWKSIIVSGDDGNYKRELGYGEVGHNPPSLEARGKHLSESESNLQL